MNFKKIVFLIGLLGFGVGKAASEFVKNSIKTATQALDTNLDFSQVVYLSPTGTVGVAEWYPGKGPGGANELRTHGHEKFERITQCATCSQLVGHDKNNQTSPPQFPESIQKTIRLTGHLKVFNDAKKTNGQIYHAFFGSKHRSVSPLKTSPRHQSIDNAIEEAAHALATHTSDRNAVLYLAPNGVVGVAVFDPNKSSNIRVHGHDTFDEILTCPICSGLTLMDSITTRRPSEPAKIEKKIQLTKKVQIINDAKMTNKQIYAAFFPSNEKEKEADENDDWVVIN